MNAMNRKLCFSVAEAAEQLGVCRNHLYGYIDNGKLASFKLGQRRLINREALDEFRMSLQQKHLAETRGQS
jgi:excisionase family DNA binding protein